MPVTRQHDEGKTIQAYMRLPVSQYVLIEVCPYSHDANDRGAMIQMHTRFCNQEHCPSGRRCPLAVP